MQLGQRLHELWSPQQVVSVLLDHLASRAVSSDRERIAPLGRTAHVDGVRLASTDLSCVQYGDDALLSNMVIRVEAVERVTQLLEHSLDLQHALGNRQTFLNVGSRCLASLSVVHELLD